MRVILFGASGMVGQGVLLEALEAPDVTEVLAIVRSPTGRAHPKLREIVHADFHDFSLLASEFAKFDACFFTLGVSAAGMREEAYARVTYDITIAAATTCLAANPRMVFVYVSGMGTDSTEKGRTMWARVKGRTENALLAMPFRGAYMFRPGLIRPERGIKSRTTLYRVLYTLTSPIAGLLLRAMGDSATTTSRVGQAMLEVASRAPEGGIVEAKRINELAAKRLAAPPTPQNA